ncbi:MAG: CotH kinase family protein [Firmicutes bacterium]|nr:CotH kinase family protein [Bacillota bacterium]
MIIFNLKKSALILSIILMSAFFIIPSYTVSIVYQEYQSPLKTTNTVKEEIGFGAVFLDNKFPTLNITTTPFAPTHQNYQYFSSLNPRYLGISRHIRRPGHAVMTHPHHDFEFSFSEPIEIRGRGNSTWNAMGEKRPYRFRFTQNLPILGRNRYMLDSSYNAREWALIASVLDPSFMRTYTAMHLARLLGTMDFVPSLWFVHLYLDGDYRGVYMLMDQPRADSATRLLLDYTNQDPAQAEYLIEMCRHPKDTQEGVDWINLNGIPFELNIPDEFEGPNSKHVDYVRNYLERVDAATISGDRSTFESLVDLDSFVDFYLINEFIKNRDVGFSSVYYTIRNTDDGRRMFAGPLWDFDQSGGATTCTNARDAYLPINIFAAAPNIRGNTTGNIWMSRMMSHNWFREVITNRWHEISNIEVKQSINRIRQKAVVFEDEFNRNFERFPHHVSKATWRNGPLFDSSINTFLSDGYTFMAQVDYFSWWLNVRSAWFSYYLGLSDDRSLFAHLMGLSTDTIIAISVSAGVLVITITTTTIIIVKKKQRQGF